VNLPGFSIALPAGDVISTSSSPSSGKHEIKLAKPSFLQSVFEDAVREGKASVEWSSQSYSLEDWKTMLLPTMMQTFSSGMKGGRSEVLKEAVSGDGRWTYVVGEPKIPVGIGVINCDASFSLIVILARYRDIDRQFADLDRIVKSVQCSTTDANRARPVAATRLPEKFGRTPDREVQIYQALDGEQLVINFTRSDVQRDQTIYRHLIRALLENSMGIKIPESRIVLLPAGEPRPVGKSSIMRAEIPESHEAIYIGTLYCPKVDLSLINLWYAPQFSDELARERQSQLGCPGEESTPTADFASLADEACAAGEKRFCGLKEMPL
jgi:hypothetical protein